MYEKLLKVQQEIGAIKKDKDNPYFKSKYADINSMLAVVKPVLNKHGLFLLQSLTNIEGKLALKTSIYEAEQKPITGGGNVISDICPLPEMADPQKSGSAITYFRRYALQSLLALEAEDDDGNHASEGDEPPFISEKPATKPTFKI
jgi:hypothetical protein